MIRYQESVAPTERNKKRGGLRNTTGISVGQDQIKRLQATFRGELIQAADFEYEQARKIWNASVDKYPGIIARCTGVADVIAAVNFARENALLVAVRGGGHNVAGRALCEDGVLSLAEHTT
jgi:FAD/FMN-containing dehydrogenase